MAICPPGRAGRDLVSGLHAEIEQDPITHIPMWVFDLEDISLGAACQEAWKHHPRSYFAISERRHR